MKKGITASLTYSTRKFQFKPFVTVQHTELNDYAPYHNTSDAGMGPNNIYSGIGTSKLHKSTPAVFGGASLNYIPIEKLNINLNSYYFSPQEYHHLSNVLFNDDVRGVDYINGKFILNTTISYQPADGIRIFCSARNILNDNSREFFHADKVPARVFGGISYEL